MTKTLLFAAALLVASLVQGETTDHSDPVAPQSGMESSRTVATQDAVFPACEAKFRQSAKEGTLQPVHIYRILPVAKGSVNDKFIKQLQAQAQRGEIVLDNQIEHYPKQGAPNQYDAIEFFDLLASDVEKAGRAFAELEWIVYQSSQTVPPNTTNTNGLINAHYEYLQWVDRLLEDKKIAPTAGDDNVKKTLEFVQQMKPLGWSSQNGRVVALSFLKKAAQDPQSMMAFYRWVYGQLSSELLSRSQPALPDETRELVKQFASIEKPYAKYNEFSSLINRHLADHSMRQLKAAYCKSLEANKPLRIVIDSYLLNFGLRQQWAGLGKAHNLSLRFLDGPPELEEQPIEPAVVFNPATGKTEPVKRSKAEQAMHDQLNRVNELYEQGRDEEAEALYEKIMKLKEHPPARLRGK